MVDKLAPDKRQIFLHNGQKVFEWDQTLDEVNLYIELPPKSPRKLFYCKIQSKHVEVGIKGISPYLNRDLLHPVKTDDSFWTLANNEKPCLWGKISMESLFLSWEKFPTLNIDRGCELLSTVDLVPSIWKTGLLGAKNCISFQIPDNRSNMNFLQQVQVTIYAEEQGAKESSAYNPCTYNNIPVSSSSRVSRVRTGNVIFNYRYYHNKLQRTEVTEDFSCPFCLIKCASFKGVKLHLLSSHDLFKFESMYSSFPTMRACTLHFSYL